MVLGLVKGLGHTDVPDVEESETSLVSEVNNKQKSYSQKKFYKIYFFASITMT